MTQEELHARKRFYSEHLTNIILPFWLPKTDEENGGFFTCYDPSGARLMSKEKYIWSQGRCTWMYAKLAEARDVAMSDAMRQTCRAHAEMGLRFLQEHCILPEGTCAFRLSENNEPLEIFPGSGYAVSTFADCFVIMGLAAAGALLSKEAVVRLAYELFCRAKEQFYANTFRTAPDVLPEGWRGHAVPMILLNTGDELSAALRRFSLEEEALHTDEVVKCAMETIVQCFLQPEGIVLECVQADGSPLDTLYGRHLNPGHTNESMWFLMHVADRFDRKDIIRAAGHTVRCTSQLAWDETYGGMMYYLDKEGGKPRGTMYAPEQALAQAALRDWDSKLWWPHMETIYANLCGYAYTGEKEFLKTYERYHDYTFRTFPNPDKSVGEWIQLRKRDGTPNEGPIGGRLPVKDPYHTTRSLLLLVELLAELEQNGIRK